MNTIPNTAENTQKPPRTEAQIAASRLNGAKSRGPITEEGKLASSRNSLRHGLLAKMVLIEGESETAFRQLSESLHNAFAPADGSDFDEYENNLLDTMALSAWRRMRAVGMETAAVTLQIKSNRDFAAQTATSPDAGITTYQAFTALLSNSPAFELVLRYEARHARAYERAAKALRDYRKGTGRDIHESSRTNLTPAPESPTQPGTQTEPRAQASVPNLSTDAAPSHKTQHQNQPNEPEPRPNHPATPTQPQAEPRAQASVPSTSTNAAPPPTQQRILPNEPGPVTSPIPQTLPNGPKPHSNHPARNKFKKNRRRR